MLSMLKRLFKIYQPIKASHKNNKSIVVSGNSISIKGGSIFVDGVKIKDDHNIQNCMTEVIVNADRVDSVEVDVGNVIINASVYGNVITDCGNITIGGNLTGEASTDCGDVKIKGCKLPKGPELETLKENISFFGSTKRK